ncbi:MAG TPA: hypothetical protein VF331_10380 [Polyangiales bacterium]
MGANRVFFSQEAVDRWLAEERIELEGETLTLAPAGPAFRLTSAVRFLAEVAGGGDVKGLVGKTKTLETVSALAGEHAPGSVVLGDDAYEVIDGFLAELLDTERGVDALSALARLSTEG